jgi:hypothetical protein
MLETFVVVFLPQLPSLCQPIVIHVWAAQKPPPGILPRSNGEFLRGQGKSRSPEEKSRQAIDREGPIPFCPFGIAFSNMTARFWPRGVA